MASSGVAATLLEGGRTAHSCFKIPLHVRTGDDTCLCGITERSHIADEIKNSSVIIWDEAPMMSRYTIEIVDRTVKELRHNQSTMGGITTVFAGDFRQILPVIAQGTKANTLDHCLKNSSLWTIMLKCNLTKNMRLTNEPGAHSFNEYLLSIGEGRDSTMEQTLTLTSDILFPSGSTIKDVCNFVYPDLPTECNDLFDSQWLVGRGILAPLNQDVDEINTHILNRVPGAERLYLSIDTVTNPESAA